MRDHPQIGLLLSDDLGPPRREELLRHLQDCAACQAGLAAEDPSRLFGLLALRPVPLGLLDRLSNDVADAIADPAVASSRRSLRRPGWASVAASLLLAAAFGTYFLDRDGETTALAERAPAPADVERHAEPAFELLSSRGTAQVVDLSVGGERYVMIFDKDLDL